MSDIVANAIAGQIIAEKTLLDEALSKHNLLGFRYKKRRPSRDKKP